MCSLLSVLSENSSFIFNWLVTFVAFLPYFLLALLFLFVLWQFQIGWQVPFRGKRSMGFFQGKNQL